MKTTLVEPVKAVYHACPESMKFIEFKRVPLSSIVIEDGANKSRVDGLDQENLRKFIEILKNKEYHPEHHHPPVVIKVGKRYILVSGRHRYAAHQHFDLPDMYVQVVEFVACKNRSAKYWQLGYQAEENADIVTFTKKPATTRDIASSVIAMIEEEQLMYPGAPKPSQSEIINYISDCGVRKLAKKNEILSLVNKAFGNFKGVVESLSDTDKKEFKNEYIKLNNKDTNDVIHRTFKMGNKSVEDYDYRLINELTTRMLNGEWNSNIVIIGSVNGARADQIPSLRKKKKTLLKEYRERVIQLAKHFEGPLGDEFEEIPILWIPQLHGERQKYEKTRNLISV